MVKSNKKKRAFKMGPNSFFADRDGNKIDTSFEVFTPKKASEILEKHNNNNRNIRQDSAKCYAKNMMEGKWRTIPDTLCFNKKGELMNGQHRLRGVVISKIDEMFSVWKNVPEEYYALIDNGLSKRGGDILKHYGFENGKPLSGAIKRVLMHQRRGKIGGTMRVSNMETLEFALKNRSLTKSVELCLINIVGTQANLAALHFIFSKIDSVRADDFMTKLLKVSDIPKDGAIYVLREALLKAKAIANKARMSTEHECALIIKAWNAHIRNEKMKLVRYGKDERFPSINSVARLVS